MQNIFNDNTAQILLNYTFSAMLLSLAQGVIKKAATSHKAKLNRLLDFLTNGLDQ